MPGHHQQRDAGLLYRPHLPLPTPPGHQPVAPALPAAPAARDGALRGRLLGRGDRVLLRMGGVRGPRRQIRIRPQGAHGVSVRANTCVRLSLCVLCCVGLCSCASAMMHSIFVTLHDSNKVNHPHPCSQRTHVVLLPPVVEPLHSRTRARLTWWHMRSFLNQKR